MPYTNSPEMLKNQTLSKKRDHAPLRILHVVGGMNRGGIETWLMHVLRNIDRDRFQMDFLVHIDQPCPYDDEARSLGSEIIPCLSPSKPWLYARNFKRILREKRPYDIVHSHVHHFSGYVLWLAKLAGVPVRIAHSHLDTYGVDAHASFLRRLYTTLMKACIQGYATTGLAASRVAAAALFGDHWENNPPQVLHCAIDLTPFKIPVDGLLLRRECGVPEDAFIIGHVGRFEEQKNHLFLLEIAAAVVQKEPLTRLLLIGDASVRPVIEDKIQQMGLGPYVILAGARSDVPQMMLGVMDLFLLPSLHEGLPLVLMEAQAAGLPCIFSDVITQEVEVVLPLMQRLSLSQTASAWSEAILTTKKTKPKIMQTEAYQLLEQSSFNIHNSVKQLETLYREISLNEIKK
ncbi:MAG: hypothetical protein RLZZ338_1299 [Cyanobacteriota bacterium]